MSTGIVLYEMLTGSVPFYSENRAEMYMNTIKVSGSEILMGEMDI